MIQLLKSRRSKRAEKIVLRSVSWWLNILLLLQSKPTYNKI